MPIFAQGYERYDGPIRGGTWRFLPIAAAALRRNSNRRTWILFVVSLLAGSAAYWFIIAFLYAGPAMIPSLGAQNLRWFAAAAADSRFYADMMDNQSLWALLLGTVVGAGEIAEDLRTGALVFYLGKPVTRRDYVLGKVAAVSAVVLAVSLVPTVLLFLLHAGFEGSWRWFADHARVIPASLGTAAVLCLFVSALVLGVSALARRRRWATVSVAAVQVTLFVTALILAFPRDYANEREREQLDRSIRNAPTVEEASALRRQRDESFDALSSPSRLAGMRFLSPTASLCAVGRDLFGVPVPSNFSGGRHWAWLLGSSALLLGLLWSKVRAVEVVT